MRTLKILLVLFAVIFSAFSKDSQKTKEVVIVPLKFDGVIITNHSSETVCTPSGDPYPYIAHARTGWLKGNQSHGGRLIEEESTWTITSCSTDFSSMINEASIMGVNTVANGDTYTYSCIMVTNIATMEINLTITVTGGTGRFEDSSGQMILTGINTGSGEIAVSGGGSVTFAK